MRFSRPQLTERLLEHISLVVNLKQKKAANSLFCFNDGVDAFFHLRHW
jgi:hypothetical protein